MEESPSEPEIPTLDHTLPPRAAVQVEYDRRVNFAMQQNDVPIVKLLRIVNLAGDELKNIIVGVWIAGGLSPVWQREIASIAPNSTYNLDRVDLALDARVLVNQTEREVSQLHVEVTEGSSIIASEKLPIDVLAYNEWPGARSLPEILAAFVMPNHPAIDGLLAKAREHLERSTGQPAFDGYPARSALRVRQLIHSIYRALLDAELGYIAPPASYETHGQRVRTPDQLLEHRLGTCLDLALLMAACFEQAGLNPLIILIEGHAFVGVWTGDESFPEPATDDASRIRKRVQLGEVVAIEATLLTTRPAVPLAEAERAALRHLTEERPFHCAVDIRAARKMRIRPLPLRVAGTFNVVDDADAAAAATPHKPTTDAATSPDAVPTSAPDAAPAAGKPDEPPHARLERWKRKLLDLSNRNRLIHFRDSNKSVPLICPDLPAVEDALSGGLTFSIHARPALMDEQSPRSPEAAEQRTGQNVLTEFLRDELGSRRLYSPLTEAVLQRRLLEIYRAARLSFEESGANTLYLAVGFLAWHESTADDSDRRLAPILLLPLTLERRSAREGFSITLGDEEPRLNVTLLEKLRVEFGIDVVGLDDATEDEHGLDVGLILQRFRKAVRDIPRWDVIEEAHLGLFSFTKFLMWTDLQDRAHELMRNPVVKYLVERPESGFDANAAAIDPATLDEARHPKVTYCPLDSDSSQLSAVFAAEDGRSFVLEGPPGTGKSQTITNLIAQCLMQGKRVLFVAEKIAALNVVHNRLTRIGLGPFCLELHSNKSSKREVLDQLQAALEVERTAAPQAWEPHSEELASARRELNAFVSELHRERPVGRSVYELASALIAMRDTPVVPFDPAWVQSLDAAKVHAIGALIEQLRTAGDAVGGIASHPFRAVRRGDWQTSLPQQVTQATQAMHKAAGPLESSIDAALRDLRIGAASAKDLSRAAMDWLKSLIDLLLEAPRPAAAMLEDADWNHLRESQKSLIEHGRQRDAMRAQLAVRYRPTLLRENLDDLLARMRSGMSGFFITAWFKRRGVRKALAAHAVAGLPDHATVISDLEHAIRLREQEQIVARSGDVATRAFGSQWNGGEADWDRLGAVVAWVDRYRALLIHADGRALTSGQAFRARATELATAHRDHFGEGAALGVAVRNYLHALSAFDAAGKAVVDLLLVEEQKAWGNRDAQGYLAAVHETLGHWHQHLRRLPDWVHYQQQRQAAVQAGLSPLIERYESGEVPSARLSEVLDRSISQAWLDRLTDGSERLRTFHSREQERKISRFQQLDRDHLALTSQHLKARFAAQVPKVHGESSGASEMGILQRQLKLQRRHMPLRKLIQKLPNLLPRLKPCLLMSPLSVAQYLDTSYPPFDLIVFDEASQIPVWDAVGAIARGKQVIVVGDSKQLPPTNFFMKVDDEETLPDEDDFEEMESILDECSAAGLPSLRLLWHYRSKHESLITFSNYHYYDNRLQTFPSPQERSRDRGVSLRHLAGGVYDRGGDRTNKAEAEAIVAEIVSRLKDGGERSRKSIGVVTFSIPQQVLIEDMLDAARRQHPQIEPFFTGAVQEPVFVKNLENVQGDERDIILFSVCYGPDKDGRVAMAFGPLNRQGGERRLNVAVTRAREQVIVFSTIKADQIDLSRTSALAVRHLKTFLDYAERGPAAIAEAVTIERRAADARGLEKDIAAKLTERGWSVQPQVGCSGFRIDLAVRDSERGDEFLLGILCDGPFYANAPTARDRDRNRQSVLTGLGWSLHRVWSLDWWQDPQRELERIEGAIKSAQAIRAERAGRQSPPPVPAESGPKSERDAAVAGNVAAADTVSDPESAELEADTEDAGDDASGTVYRAVRPAKLYGDTAAFYAPKARRLIRDLLLRVVKREAPILWDVATKRVTSFWGFARATERAENLIREILSIIPDSERPKLINDVLWRASDEPSSYITFRVAGDDDEQPRKAEEIPTIEYANAAASVLEQQIGLPREALMKEVARMFGFTRVTSRAQPCIEAAINDLAARGRCVISDGIVTLPR